MGHIHEGVGQHDLTASAFIVRDDGSEPRVLLHMHKKLGKLVQPGGHVELDETPWQAIQHELSEETGYVMTELEVLQPPLRIQALTGATLHPYPAVLNTHIFDPEGRHRHTDIAFGFVAYGDAAAAPGDGESLDLRWLTADELIAVPDAEIIENVRDIARFVLRDILPHWEHVALAEFS